MNAVLINIHASEMIVSEKCSGTEFKNLEFGAVG
jgi:hypothetical protein